MAKANARTIYVREDDWKRWDDLAYAARVSRSEYIRRAVEAYDGLSGDASQGRSAHERLASERDATGTTGESSHATRDEARVQRREPVRSAPVATGPSGLPRTPVLHPDDLRPESADAQAGEASGRHTESGEVLDGNHTGGTPDAFATGTAARSERDAKGRRHDRQAGGAASALGQPTEARAVKADPLAGAVKREAKALHVGESDPAAPPPRGFHVTGISGSPCPTYIPPVTKESQTKRHGRKKP